MEISKMIILTWVFKIFLTKLGATKYIILAHIFIIMLCIGALSTLLQ
uniref:Uncharacterized protein n=1 Tax=Rhizophora mucronata TaxID=61149 RepID=A0A2P2PLZ7_RHIMU